MPEGHSIHRLARQFTSVFAGEALRASSPQGRFAEGAERIDGAVLTRARAHGKQLFLEFDNDLVMRVHLGLYGAWSFGGDSRFRGASSIGAPRRVGERETADDDAPAVYAGPPLPVGAVRVRLVSAHGWADLRGPTACEVITGAERDAIIARLGPDPLDPDTPPAEFIARVQRTRTAVGLSLMNQAVIAGVGNVYRAEVLFRRRVHPWLPGPALGDAGALALWEDLVLLMNEGVRAGRIITTTPNHRSSGAGNGSAVPAEEAHYVYKRTGQECRICGTSVAMAEMGARKLYWCPYCQAA
ncbi:DNA-formamidopyrimidine glycosylase family protein [Arthrobacter sp. EH-1B-1]|uniref:DNA-(apurinic or apyrimidinic site) lyase n=1 Tax=Arthrobacter vasquezii TaxID=2977629 RepID=A0ABT6CRC3_9MICC|nr:DNA glycosylase [Arthrobacter vasquezii]MDF9276626.1 DNA-formamidopyrimidine glycosylase family protein [Arthrobacter vasquezii]